MKHTTYTTIETVDGKYKLYALWYYETNEFKAPSLCLPNEEHWDNEVYLLETLLPFLKKQYKKVKDKHEIDNLKRDIPKEYRKELKGIIKQGIKLGFFDESLEK
jgi:hypothetical protein